MVWKMSEQEVEKIVAAAFEEQGLSERVRMSGDTELADAMQRSMKQIAASLSSGLTLNDYQEMAMETAVYPKEFKVIYPALGITGEAGEVSDKIKKLIRDKGYRCGSSISNEDKHDIALELGDVLWYVVTSAHDLGYSLEQVALMNYQKLSNRKKQGVIGGSGDHRGEMDFPEIPVQTSKYERNCTIAAIAILSVLIALIAIIWNLI